MSDKIQPDSSGPTLCSSADGRQVPVDALRSSAAVAALVAEIHDWQTLKKLLNDREEFDNGVITGLKIAKRIIAKVLDDL